MKFRLYILICFIFASLSSSAQTEKTALSAFKQAKKEYASLKYVAAISLLEKAIPAMATNVEVQEIFANSYRKIKDYKNALVWYEKLSKAQPLKPEWALCYAEILANNERYKESEMWYKQYLVLASSDHRARGFAIAYSGDLGFMKNKRRWKVYYTNLNSLASEYAPAFYKDGLVFVSNRNIGNLSKHVFGWDQTPFSDLYFVKNLDSIKPVNADSLMTALKSKQNYKINDDDTRTTSNDNKIITVNQSVYDEKLAPKLYGNELVKPLDGFVNTKYHEGPVAVLPDGSIIFTRNNYFDGKAKTSRQGINKLKIFTASAPGLDEIKPFPFNNDEYSTGHPAVNKEGTILIFSSDMPGGKGGVDLYVSRRANLKEEWGKPVNLGDKVNTEGDEMFPTFYNDNTLFFSSTGHAGLGGLDIFEIAINNSEISGQPLNLGAPVNSSSDDFSFIRAESGFKGFFTSNRLGNDDIFGFQFQDYRIKLEGTLADNLTKQLLANAQIQIVANGNTSSFYTNEKGAFTKELPQKSLLDLTVSKPGYAFFSQRLSTQNIDDDTTITRNIELKSLEKETAATANNCDIIKFAQELKIYYDLDKSMVRNDAAPIMQKLAVLLKEYPQFNVIASSYCDSRASKEYNLELSIQRSKNARAYLIANGIDENRIEIRSYGEEKLVNNCKDGVVCDEAHQQLNRRTEFFISYKGKDIKELKCEDLKDLR